ncbi:MAG: C1 family peptidase [Deltaproteobacteria bacterium]|nr:C1 family peptidase [Deltaproteobacteria bacterium]
MRAAAILLLATGALMSCDGTSSHQPPAAPSPIAPPPRVGTPLPPGWVWPFNLANVVKAFDPYTIYRPIDVSRLAHATGPCAPVEVASNVWIQPLCARLPRIVDSSAVPSRKGFDGGALPAGVDLRQSGYDGPVKNQGMVGICWSFAISTVMDNGLRRQARPDVIAPLHVMSSGTWNELWSKGRTEHAMVREQEWPYDPVKACRYNEDQSEVWCDQAYHVQHGTWRSDPQLVAELQRADASGTWRIASMEKLATSPADPNQIASVLAGGQSVYVGMNINMEAFRHQNVRGGVIPDYAYGEAGHAMVVVGYRPFGVTRQFLLHNSWGADWAEGGYAWISEAMIARFTDQAFVVGVAAGGASSPPSPIPIPTTTTTAWPPGVPTNLPFPVPGMPGGGGAPGTGGCAAGQARDMVFGSCASACAGGAPPVAGICVPGGAAGSTPAPTTPGSCPAGQVRDWLTGTCSAQCSSGLPPAGGVCLP